MTTIAIIILVAAFLAVRGLAGFADAFGNEPKSPLYGPDGRGGSGISRPVDRALRRALTDSTVFVHEIDGGSAGK